MRVNKIIEIEIMLKPITQPALYAVLKASARDSVALNVVLKLAWTAIFMPM